MELIRWNPTKGIFGLRSRMNHIFDDFCYPAPKDDEASFLMTIRLLSRLSCPVSTKRTLALM